MNNIKHVLHGYICSNSDGISESFLGESQKKFGGFNAREETLISAFLWHAGRTKEELSGVMRMSRLWRSGDFLTSESHRKTVFPC